MKFQTLSHVVLEFGTLFFTFHTQNGDVFGTLTIDEKHYNMLYFQIHTGSEHLVHGVQSDLEIHYVHESDDGEYSVVGVLCNAGHVLDAKMNTFWQALTDSINNLDSHYFIDVTLLMDALNTRK